MLKVDVVVISTTTSDPDRYGDTTVTTAQRTVEKCIFVDEHSTESHDPDRPALIVPATVYMPKDPPQSADDELLIRGLRYAVEGEPIDWSNPLTGRRFPWEVKLKRTG